MAKTLVEKIEVHNIPIGEFHHKLGIKGRYDNSGLTQGLSPEQEKKGVSHDNDAYHIITRSSGRYFMSKTMKVEEEKVVTYTFKVARVKNVFGLEGEITSIHIEDNHYEVIVKQKRKVEKNARHAQYR